MKFSNIYISISVFLIISSLLWEKYHIMGIDYVFFLLLVVCWFVYMTTHHYPIQLPKGYNKWLVILILIALLSSFLSPYPYGVFQIAFGLFIFLMPFIFFIISYNLKWSATKIIKYIDLIINVILCIGISILLMSLFMPWMHKFGLLANEVFGLGFCASLFNQAIILCLARYQSSKNKKYIYKTLFFGSLMIASIQLKAILGLLIILSIYLFLTNRNKINYWLKIAVTLVFILSVSINIPGVANKINEYSSWYSFSNPKSDIARVALYLTSTSIAKDFFPLGSGQGTFGSQPSKQPYNKIYHDYRIDNVYGLQRSKSLFILDTHWAMILGENGIFGLIVYLILFFYPVGYFIKRVNKNNRKLSTWIILLASPVTITIESLMLPLPNRFAFMTIYAGIVGLLLNNTFISNNKIVAG